MVNELMELAEKRHSLMNCTFEIGHHEEEEHGHGEGGILEW